VWDIANVTINSPFRYRHYELQEIRCQDGYDGDPSADYWMKRISFVAAGDAVSNAKDHKPTGFTMPMIAVTH
jgi:hypothetical protein